MSQNPPSTGDTGFPGQQRLQDATGEYNKMLFLLRQMLGFVRTATLVQVKKVSTDPDTISEVGFVDVLPLVKMTDGFGNSFDHSTVFNLPYFRLQGGKNAVLVDPAEGDIGLAVFADRDISAVKKNKDVSVPGSRRRFDFADGLYLGGFLNAEPEQYVQFKSDGITILDKNGNSFEMVPGGITLTDNNGNVINMSSTGIAITGELKNNGIHVGSTHTHSGVTTGGGNTGIPNP